MFRKTITVRCQLAFLLSISILAEFPKDLVEARLGDGRIASATLYAVGSAHNLLPGGEYRPRESWQSHSKERTAFEIANASGYALETLVVSGSSYTQDRLAHSAIFVPAPNTRAPPRG